MLVFASIDAGGVLVLTGDVLIEGDIGEGAQITLMDGSLTVLGTVGSGAQIRVRLSEMLRNKSVEFNPGFGFVNNSIRQANTMLDEHTYLGAVNIDNRIFTEDQVQDHGQDRFTITAAAKDSDKGSYEDEKTADCARAIIDDVLYMGAEIQVEGKKVFIGGREVTQSDAASAHLPSNLPCVVRILGDIQDEVYLESDAEMEANNLGKCVRIVSEFQGFKAQQVGSGCNIKVSANVEVTDVAQHCGIHSKHGGVKAKNIDGDCIIEAKTSIDVAEVGNGCSLTANEQGIKALNVGVETKITANTQIELRDVGSNANVCSQQGSVSVQDVHPHVFIRAGKMIDVRGTCLGPNTLLLKNPVELTPKRSPTKSRGMQQDEPRSNITASYGLFFKPAPAQKQTVPIPKGYVCPITKALMQKPMLLKSNGVSYEEKALRAWILQHGYTPDWRQKINSNQPTDNIFTLNKNLLEAIVEFTEKNPEVLDAKGRSPGLGETEGTAQRTSFLGA